MPIVSAAFLIFVILFLVLFFYFVPLGMWVQAVVFAWYRSNSNC